MKETEAQILRLALYDPLTELPNRRLVDDRLNQALAESKRTGRHGALMFLDLDNYKALNDVHAHVVGDLLLMEVAKRLRTCVRGVDSVARFGGDEFVVLVSDLSADREKSIAQVRVIAEKIRHSLAAPYLLNVKHAGKPDAMVEHQCSASIGIVVFVKQDADGTDLLKWADAAMYQAKDAGRNAIQYYQESRQT
jgi:diguanylate cyclase (GGDEF)-like protein